MGAPKDSAIELQSRGGQTAGDASPSASVSTDAASGAGAGAGAAADTSSSVVDASSKVYAAAETAAVFTDVPLLDSPATAQSSSGGGVTATADSAAAEQQGEPRVSSEFKVRTGRDGNTCTCLTAILGNQCMLGDASMCCASGALGCLPLHLAFQAALPASPRLCAVCSEAASSHGAHPPQPACAPRRRQWHRWRHTQWLSRQCSGTCSGSSWKADESGGAGGGAGGPSCVPGVLSVRAWSLYLCVLVSMPSVCPHHCCWCWHQWAGSCLS